MVVSTPATIIKFDLKKIAIHKLQYVLRRIRDPSI